MPRNCYFSIKYYDTSFAKYNFFLVWCFKYCFLFTGKSPDFSGSVALCCLLVTTDEKVAETEIATFNEFFLPYYKLLKLLMKDTGCYALRRQ